MLGQIFILYVLFFILYVLYISMPLHLSQADIEFVQAAGVERIREAAYHFVRTRLVSGDAVPDEGHPVFKAMNAIGADDRESLEENFLIKKDKKLTEAQIDMIVENIIGWIRGELQNSGKTQARIKDF